MAPLKVPRRDFLKAALAGAVLFVTRPASVQAQANTGKDAIFQFPDAGQALYPGLFRVFAQRTVYVDWKGGGQVNLLEDFATEWWKRWQAAGDPKATPESLAALGIDFMVLQPAHALTGREPDYRNAKYVVYRLR